MLGSIDLAAHNCRLSSPRKRVNGTGSQANRQALDFTSSCCSDVDDQINELCISFCIIVALSPPSCDTMSNRWFGPSFWKLRCIYSDRAAAPQPARCNPCRLYPSSSSFSSSTPPRFRCMATSPSCSVIFFSYYSSRGLVGKDNCH